MSGRSRLPFANDILDAPITCLVTALILGIFGIAWTKGSHAGLSLTLDTLITYGANNRFHVWEGEYWRLLASVFLHAGWVHMLWNLWSMVGWCAGIERLVGWGWFAFAYLTTGIGASACSVLGHATTSVGASGAGFGMIAVILALLYRRAGDLEAFRADPFAHRLLVNTGAWALVGYLGLAHMDNWAHAGGFLFGIPCGLLLGNRRGKKRGAWIAGLAAYSLVWAAVVAAACIPGLGMKERGFGP